MLARRFKLIKDGKLELQFPNLKTVVYGDEASSKTYHLHVKDYRLLNLIVSRGSMGFGEAYMQGYWGSTDVVELMMFLFLIELLYMSVKVYLAIW